MSLAMNDDIEIDQMIKFLNLPREDCQGGEPILGLSQYRDISTTTATESPYFISKLQDGRFQLMPGEMFLEQSSMVGLLREVIQLAQENGNKQYIHFIISRIDPMNIGSMANESDKRLYSTLDIWNFPKEEKSQTNKKITSQPPPPSPPVVQTITSQSPPPVIQPTQPIGIPTLSPPQQTMTDNPSLLIDGQQQQRSIQAVNDGGTNDQQQAAEMMMRQRQYRNGQYPPNSYPPAVDPNMNRQYPPNSFPPVVDPNVNGQYPPNSFPPTIDPRNMLPNPMNGPSPSQQQTMMMNGGLPPQYLSDMALNDQQNVDNTISLFGKKIKKINLIIIIGGLILGLGAAFYYFKIQKKKKGKLEMMMIEGKNGKQGENGDNLYDEFVRKKSNKKKKKKHNNNSNKRAGEKRKK